MVRSFCSVWCSQLFAAEPSEGLCDRLIARCGDHLYATALATRLMRKHIVVKELHADDEQPDPEGEA